jgi:hypothetical protein
VKHLVIRLGRNSRLGIGIAKRNIAIITLHHHRNDVMAAVSWWRAAMPATGEDISGDASQAAGVHQHGDRRRAGVGMVAGGRVALRLGGGKNGDNIARRGGRHGVVSSAVARQQQTWRTVFGRQASWRGKIERRYEQNQGGIFRLAAKIAKNKENKWR